MNWLFNTCRRHETNLSLLAAGALAESDQAELRAHLAQCPVCQAKLAEMQALARSLTEAGQHLPEIEAPISLRRRWMTAVRESAREDAAVHAPLRPGWWSSQRVAWSGLAAIWALVLFFRFSAPDAPKPVQLAAAPPVSLREVLLALKVEERKTNRRADATLPDRKPDPHPDALPPRSQRSPTQSENTEVA